MLTYAHTSLRHQEAVWGLVTNGEIYRFFYIQNGTPTVYYHMPSLSLMRSKQLTQLLQVLKAIRDWIVNGLRYQVTIADSPCIIVRLSLAVIHEPHRSRPLGP